MNESVNQMKSQRKPYETPEITVYGDIRKITLSANETNADMLQGNSDTAYPPGS